MAAFFYEEDRPSPAYEAWERERARPEWGGLAEYRAWWRRQQMREDALNSEVGPT
jgi:hypothetical protein